ncbi:hypothetical protein F5148DRAFT_1376386 [Russula earlei]|uniref:Uncharacterized protein n=1 Tax=Russula earlei TaxID=71964 RepID=A0ACC0U9B2_9AGAM|nr:hypothetical protein F5148DRAFT_1376386 [Russula earlei]
MSHIPNLRRRKGHDFLQGRQGQPGQPGQPGPAHPAPPPPPAPPQPQTSTVDSIPFSISVPNTFTSDLRSMSSLPLPHPLILSSSSHLFLLTPSFPTTTTSSFFLSPTLSSSSSDLFPFPTFLTTSSSLPVISTTSITSNPLPTLASHTTLTFVQTLASQQAVVSSSHPSPTSTGSPVSGVSTGVIAGGILAAVLGSAGILFALVYFLRRSRRREDEAVAEEIWNRPDALSPSSDHDRAPPKELAIHAIPSTSLPSEVSPTILTGNGYGATGYVQPSFSPGDIVSPASAEPFFSSYAQDVMVSPVSSNVPDYHDAPPPLGPPPPPPALTRLPSNGTSKQSHLLILPERHYVDLSRSSLTRSQAAQYAEISKKLHTPMSSVLGTVPENASPFVDPDANHPAPVASHNWGTDDPLPTPILVNHSRVSSKPPILPEIRVPDSPAPSLEIPVPLSARESPSPFTVEFSNLRIPPPEGLKYKSSPLATASPVQDQPASIPRDPKTEAEPAKRPDTVYTLYDEEDAYGGI